MKRIFFLSIILLILSSCGKFVSEAENATMDYAKGFSITDCGSYTKVVINNPWNLGAFLHTYILVNRDSVMPQDLPNGTVIKVPLRNVLVYSDVHARAIKELGCIESVTGVCDAKYFKTPEIRNGLYTGHIMNCGSTMAPAVEKIVSIKPEAVLLSPFENAGYGALERMNIPIVELADYMESTPLGRAEWIKVLGLLFGKENLADSIFVQTQKSYTTLVAKTATVKTRPKVISEYVINGVWYVPGGKSYKAALYKDAGASYPWADDTSTGSLALDFPQVLNAAKDADYWFVTTFGCDLNNKNFLDLYPGNNQFVSYQKGNVYYANSEESTVFEETPFHPDLLLKEYVRIFHPELLPDYELKYYQQIAEK